MNTRTDRWEALRQRYAPEPAPTCRHCHATMEEVPSSEFGGTIRWRCPNDGSVKYTEAGDPEVLAALDALTAAWDEVAAWRALPAKEGLQPGRHSTEDDDGPDALDELIADGERTNPQFGAMVEEAANRRKARRAAMALTNSNEPTSQQSRPTPSRRLVEEALYDLYEVGVERGIELSRDPGSGAYKTDIAGRGEAALQTVMRLVGLNEDGEEQKVADYSGSPGYAGMTGIVLCAVCKEQAVVVVVGFPGMPAVPYCAKHGRLDINGQERIKELEAEVQRLREALQGAIADLALVGDAMRAGMEHALAEVAPSIATQGKERA